MDETKVIYHIDDEDTPYLVKLPKSPTDVTLSDFKNVLNRPSYKFFFKSMDDDFGVVKEEISDEEMNLPCFNGRVVAWLVTSDTSSVSDTGRDDQQSVISAASDLHPPMPRTVGIGDSRPPSFHHGGHSTTGDFDSEVDSTVSSRRGSRRREKHSGINRNEVIHGRRRHDGDRYESASMMSSDIETTSYQDSSDDQSSVSRFSSTTEGSQLLRGRHRRRRRRPRMPRVQRCSSFSTITESTMSLNIITVTLNMEKVNFLGISIVGQSNKRGDGGIYVGSIMKGGAVDLDGRIEPGDMLLQVNDVNFENMSNDDAVRVLREMVHKPGPITLTVAKCWDPTPKGYFTLPPSEPVRPIDTSAWVQHTTAMAPAQYGKQPNSQSLATMTSTSSSMTSSLPESDRYTELQEGEGLSVNTDMSTIVKTMASPESGLDVRDRMWLKITIPNAFIGSDVVDWLYSHVEGFQDRREARKYACNLLKAGFIRHTVNKITFSEQCYYVFGDLCGNMAALSINEHEGDGDNDTLGPLPPHQQGISWMAGPPSYGYHQMPPYPTGPQTMVDPQTPGYAQSFYSGHSGSQSPHSASGSSKRSGGGGGSNRGDGDNRSSGGSSSEKSGSSKGKGKDRDRDARSVDGSAHPMPSAPPPMVGVPMPGVPMQGVPMPGTPGLAMIPRPLDQVPDNLSASRNSFRMAMGNPCEFFVDVM